MSAIVNKKYHFCRIFLLKGVDWLNSQGTSLKTPLKLNVYNKKIYEITTFLKKFIQHFFTNMLQY